MSLLMDALNKAEQAKRQNQASEAEAGADANASSSPEKAESPALKLELTPLMVNDPPPPAAVPPALPELPAHLGMLDEEFMAHAATSKPPAKDKKPARPGPAEPSPAPTPPPAPVAPKPAVAPPPQKAEAEDRQAAQNLFDAKQQARPPLSKKRLALVLGLLTLLAAGGIGFYFWLQLQPAGGLSMANLSATPRPLPPPPQAVPTAAPTSAPAVPPTPPATAAVPPVPAVAAVRPVAAAAPERNDPPSPIRVSTAKIVLNPALANAYEAYLAGNFDVARSEYMQVLSDEPGNLDALHGMAAISLRQRQFASAEEYYLRAIEADPKDALAQAGLIGLKGQTDPFLAETRLNSLHASQPDLPAINFALGTLYASQNRWSEAQTAYFRAYKGDPDNPDTLFNLAVSLDHLNQPRLALQYYNLALAAAANRPASFDRAQLGTRLRELQPRP